MSHLGIVSMLTLAAKGFYCQGFDLNRSLIKQLNDKKWPIYEPGLDKLFNKVKNNINFSNNLKNIKRSNLVYISQDVPTNQTGKSNLLVIEEMICKISTLISPDTRIIILCQVPPGFTRAMQKYHKKISYQVETLVFGDALKRANAPERIIVGEDETLSPVDKDYRKVLESYTCPILTMNMESAEFTKISINAFLSSMIITTNSLNELARKVGANWNSVIGALKLDKRIGEFAYINPGLGITGGNLERDLHTLESIYNKNYSSGKSFFHYIKKFSIRQKKWLNEIVSREIIEKSLTVRIGILGVAYKTNTSSIKNSIAIELIRKFPKNVFGYYDPQATLPDEFSHVKKYRSIRECIQKVDALVILTPWEEFANLGVYSGIKNKSFTIIDPYGIVKKLNSKTVKIFQLAAT